MKINKIHLIGSPGSGKTTLSKIISKKLKIPLYSFDDIQYKIKFSKKRSLEYIKKKLKKISKKNAWITEGNFTNYATEIFRNTDLVILLKPRKIISKWRILKRYLKRKNKFEKDSLKGAINLIKRVNKYHSTKIQDKIVHPSLNLQIDLIKKYNKKIIILKNKKEINKFIIKLK